jgi:AcrR family transcriptional regulator
VTGAPTQTKGDATRQRVLACAVARFADDGFRQTSVAQVARDAGVTAPTVHAHYGSKEELFRAAFEHDIAALLDVITARLASGALPGLGGGLRLIPDLLAAIDDHPLARRVFQGREADRTRELLTVPAVVRTRERLTDLVAGGQRAGLIRGDLAPEALAGALETLVLALLLGAVQVGMIGDEQRRLALVAIIAAGIRPPA